MTCPIGCSLCADQDVCFSCSEGYFSRSAALFASSPRPSQCIKCKSPCYACTDSEITCISCVTPFKLQGTQCVSKFNFQVKCTLNVDFITFNQNYYDFINAVAKAAKIALNTLTMLSVKSGSVIAVFLVNSQYTPASNEAVSQQDAIQKSLSGKVAGMQVSSTSVTTNGGSNIPADDSGDDNTLIIVLAIVIPVGK
jgi:hypothetical protein